jgi:hypothetical protein
MTLIEQRQGPSAILSANPALLCPALCLLICWKSGKQSGKQSARPARFAALAGIAAGRFISYAFDGAGFAGLVSVFAAGLESLLEVLGALAVSFFAACL